VIGIDYNARALRRARALAARSRFASRLRFYPTTLPTLPAPVRAQTFDLVHASGVLHHCADPSRSLHALAARVREDGFLIVRGYQTITALQRFLKRLIVRLGVGEDEAAMANNAQRFFREDLERSVANSNRDLRQALYDNFLNPHYAPFDMRALQSVCVSFGLRVHALSPGTDASPLFGPGRMPAPDESEASGAWWSVALTRAAAAREPASAFLERCRAHVAACGRAGERFEEAVHALIAHPDEKSWDAVCAAADYCLAQCVRATRAVADAAADECTTFAREMALVRPRIKECLARWIPLGEMPATTVFLRGMSGFPMTSWVLWKPPRSFRSPWVRR
jgi:hypothetical protein